MSQDNAMELLLAMELPQPQQQQYKIKRLSALCGQDVVFTLGQLTYNRVEQLRQMEHESDIRKAPRPRPRAEQTPPGRQRRRQTRLNNILWFGATA